MTNDSETLALCATMIGGTRHADDFEVISRVSVVSARRSSVA